MDKEILLQDHRLVINAVNGRLCCVRFNAWYKRMLQ